MTLHCGCSYTAHEPTGAMRRAGQCQRHARMRRDPASLGESYYAQIGTIKDDKAVETHHLIELAEALGPFPRSHRNWPRALEIGCGASPYIGHIRAAGYLYEALDPSPWAAGWMRRTYGCEVACRDFETFDATVWRDTFSLVLAAHSFEHMADAPTAIAKAASMLESGGELWVIVPDDGDPTNPDHDFLFTEASLRKAVELAGLNVLALESRQIIKRERFLYLRAVKP